MKLKRERLALANETSPLKLLIIGFLATKGEVLANDASDASVTAAVQRMCDKAAAAAVSGNKTVLENERATLNTALSNERAAHVAAQEKLSNAVADRDALCVDLVIAQGKLAVADRDTKITALANSTDWKKDSDALLKLPVKFKLAGTPPDAKALANAGIAGTDANPRITFQGIIRSKRAADKSLSYDDAFKVVANENPALFQQMISRPQN